MKTVQGAKSKIKREYDPSYGQRSKVHELENMASSPGSHGLHRLNRAIELSRPVFLN